ncbi:hypothetical protein [Burkholderia stabilis]|uniref:hypothetical protein n=1 Tax=Burkholderia stabilis TaxID=95485 RepID=UPI001F4B1BCC|nr:hypothetical protein [Burkholderia stabilis]
MYIILTTKPAQYRSEAAEGIHPLDSYAYHYEGRHVATFTIAEADGRARVRIVELDDSGTVNLVPVRFFEQFPTQQAALQSLDHLTGNSHGVATLLPVALS